MFGKNINYFIRDKNKYIASRINFAKLILQQMHGRKFFYSMPELLDDTGICIIENITYDMYLDVFIYIIKDCDTNQIYITDRCNLYLVEMH